MRVLGISAFYHDSAAALVCDGEIIAAAQEERFTRRKHDPGFPRHAVEYCLKEGGVGVGGVDLFAFYDKPLLKFERLLETYLAFAPRGFKSFSMAIPIWLREKLFLQDLLARELARLGTDRKSVGSRLVFSEHHLSHAASAFFPSPFDEAVVLTMDGVGEWATTSLAHGSGNKLEVHKEIHFPHSLGLLYSAFTYYTGFKVNSGEYKVMGLAPYGDPVYTKLIYDHLLDLKADGTFRLNLEYFDYCTGLTMTNARFDTLFGGPARKPEQRLTQRDMNLAASIQAVTEEAVLRLARSVAADAGSRKLCLAGGVALNCVANGKLLRDGAFSDLWIQPAAGDAGGALGAAFVAGSPAQGRATRPAGRTARSHEGRLSGAFIRAVGHRKAPHRCRGEIRGPFRRTDHRRLSAGTGRGKGAWLVSGQDGIRAAGARRAIDSRRCAFADDAVKTEPEGQAPGVVPAVCTVRAARAPDRLLRTGP